jgi:acyl carrier protein
VLEVVHAGSVARSNSERLVVKSSVKPKPNESEILDWCLAYLATNFKTPREHIRPHEKFARLGMDSAASVFFIVELEDWLGAELPTEIVFAHPTPAELAHYIAGRYGAQSGASS